MAGHPLTEGQNIKLRCTIGEKMSTKNISFIKGNILKSIIVVEF